MTMRAEKLSGVDLLSLPPGKYGDGNGIWFWKQSATAASFYLRISVNGKLRHLGLGALKDTTLEGARERAAMWRRAYYEMKHSMKDGATEEMQEAFYDKLNEALSFKQPGDDI